MTKDDIIKILNKYYDPKQMELDQYNWNDYFKSIADEILALQPTDADILESAPNYMDFAFRIIWMEGAKAFRDGKISHLVK